MKILSINVIVIIFIFWPSHLLAKSDYTKWGDYNQFTVPLLSLGFSWYKKDYKSLELLAKSYITTQGITHFTKKIINAKRPNGGNHSFPSGHTASAFTGVNFLYKHYGPTYALPALLIASSVGHSRIKGKYHTLFDVVCGALLSIGIDEFYYRKMELKPIRVGGAPGIQLNLSY
tara:strand:+ start:1216 stop:1737 length:522 start_codon:yes stop_codon:yes gene_type:complete